MFIVILLYPHMSYLQNVSCLFTPSHLVYGCWWAVIVYGKSGQNQDRISIGTYEACGEENGKEKYCKLNEDPGATLHFDLGATQHFDSDQNRWTLDFEDKGRKMQYSSSDNADRNVPWGETIEMSGTSWRQDADES